MYIIATYGPTPNNDERAKESMWQKQQNAMKNIPIIDRQKDPREQYIEDLQQTISKINKLKNSGVLLLGDINIDPRQDTKHAQQWKATMNNTNMTNTVLNRWPGLTQKLHTWKTKLLDHIYISRNSTQYVTAAGIETGKTAYKSDHNMVGARIKFSKIIGRTKNSNERYIPPKRVLKYSNKDNVTLYQEAITKRHEKRKKKNKDMISKINRAFDYAKLKKLNKKEQKKLQSYMDSAMKTTIKELLAAERDIDENKSKTNSTNYKGGATARRSWSDTYAKKVTIINLLKATIKYCNIPKHRGKIKNTIKSITVRCKLMSLEMASEILNIPNTETMTEKETRKALKEYEKHIRKMLIIWERGTNLRARNKWRTKLKEYKKKREEQRKIPHEVKKFYNYALKRPSPAEKPEVIFDGDKILDTKEEIHKREEQYLAEFMGKQRKRWYLREGIIHPNLAKTKKGKKWRKKYKKV